MAQSQQETNDESSPSGLPAGLLDTEMTNQVSEILDEQQNTDFNTAISESLSHMLSLRSAISPTSFAANDPIRLGPNTRFRKIGFGQCGLVFERPGHPYVIRLARASYSDGLWADLIAHSRVYSAFVANETVECRIPAVLRYISKHSPDWLDISALFNPDEITSDFSLPAMALMTGRIPPLPKVVRNALITKFCPPYLQKTAIESPINRDCLARIYLGRRRGSAAPLSHNFTLRNFNLNLDQMLDLNLPVEEYAVIIDQALAVIHWAANVDAYDVEFVLGSEAAAIIHSSNPAAQPDDDLTQLGEIGDLPPHTDVVLAPIRGIDFQRHAIRIWCLDFNLCNCWDSNAIIDGGAAAREALIAHLVLAFFENGPYYTLPLMESAEEQHLWAVFKTSYLRKATAILAGKDQRLAGFHDLFIAGCVELEREKLSAGKGHGHRDLKQ